MPPKNHSAPWPGKQNGPAAELSIREIRNFRLIFGLSVWHRVCIRSGPTQVKVEPAGSAGWLRNEQYKAERVCMRILKVALGLNRMTDGDLSGFGGNIINCMTGNAAFSKPPVALADVGKLLAAFNDAIAAAMDGGASLTVAKNAAREALLAALRKLAAYVQMVADHDEVLLRTSGFSPINLSRAQTKLDVPLIVSVENEGTAKLSLRLKRVANARSYEVRATNGAAVPAASLISTQARRVIVGNLTPGTVYHLQARAIGGSEGYSEWSDPVSHMAI